MKRLLTLLSGLFFSAMLQGQNLKIDVQKFKEDSSYRNSLTRVFVGRNKNADTIKIVPPMAYLVNPKPGVHRLPQDNMPCLVPDQSGTVAIPNFWAERVEIPFTSKPPRMPNPAPRFRFAPSHPLTIYPNTDTNTK